MANLECNAVCGVAITHHFLAKMVRAGAPVQAHGRLLCKLTLSP